MKKRTKTIPAIITGVAILIGGIWLINESRYPNVPAFDDHFTRKFLSKDKKVDDGFYEFKSKTGQYTMWFPEEYTLLSENGDYARDNKDFEQWEAVPSTSETKAYRGAIYVRMAKDNKRNHQDYLESFFKDHLISEQPKLIKTGKTEIYFSSAHFEINEKNQVVEDIKQKPNSFYAYIIDKASNKVIEFSFETSGFKNKQFEEEKQRKWLMKILRSVQFYG
ncbi:hypothetical protein ACFC4S_08370 [Priestia megaterium]|uniref:hypothetical protein n=1 Tax=Priestia megaterium TaxID=1404 RepID=UPI0035D80DDC